MAHREKGNHFLFGEMDLFDQLILLVIGVVVLLVNLGFLDRAWLAYWPVLLVLVAFKEIMQNR